MYAGPLRQARALTLSAACVALSLAGHLAGGGTAPMGTTPLALAALLALTTLIALVLGGASRRRWTFGRAVIALAGTQLVLHGAFTWLVDEPHAMAGMSHSGPSGAGMTLGHTAAALLVALLVAVTDGSLETRSLLVTAASSVSAAVAPWRVAPLAAAATRPRPRPAGPVGGARWQRPRILAGLVVLQCLSRRGPPVTA